MTKIHVFIIAVFLMLPIKAFEIGVNPEDHGGTNMPLHAKKKLKGLVVLIDFSDRPGWLSRGHLVDPACAALVG